MSLFEELRRRNVFKVGTAYAIVAAGYLTCCSSVTAQTDGEYQFRVSQRTESARAAPSSGATGSGSDVGTLLTCFMARSASDREFLYFRARDVGQGSVTVDYFMVPNAGEPVVTTSTLSRFTEAGSNVADAAFETESFAEACEGQELAVRSQAAFRDIERWGSSRIEVDAAADYRSMTTAAGLVCDAARYTLSEGFRYFRLQRPLLSTHTGELEYFAGPPPGLQVLGARPDSDGPAVLRGGNSAVVEAAWFAESCERGTAAVLESGLRTITLPVRVHLLTFESSPDLAATLTSAQVTEVLEEANAIWKPAGIRWAVESVVQEEAINQREMRNRGRASGSRLRVPADTELVELIEAATDVCPTKNWLEGGWNICVIRRFAYPELDSRIVNAAVRERAYVLSRAEVGWLTIAERDFQADFIASFLGHPLGVEGELSEMTEEHIDAARAATRNSLGPQR